ncbi:unnamed protein product [Cylicocyclus nassatus]|uniref:tRNA-intron lyase n=1 Tax=Cylicocyclus nassatus TaxID=53992 RepID=A0AA36GWR9_CYLNA|nr:unnamed protein product [Cylicocyclus nassatus]
MEDVARLRNEWRMIAELPASSRGQPPHFLSPEQVSILVLYGAARVRRLKRNSSCPLEGDSAEIPPTGAEVPNCSTVVTQGLLDTDDPLSEPQEWFDELEVPLPCTRDHRAREIIFHDLWRKGYYLTSGEQFGCAYLVYEGLPGELHAKYLVDYVMEEEDLSVTNIISLVRVATQVKKILLLAIVASNSNQPHYLTFDWFKPYSKEIE